MGRYTDNLFRKNRLVKHFDRKKQKAERLTGCAIRRNREWHAPEGCRSHAEVRRLLGDENEYQSRPGDVEGFITSEGRHVGRSEAVIVGIGSGQVPPAWRGVSRELLSSDINW